jgi:hypothetical protein
MTRQYLVVALVLAVLMGAVGLLVWRENERRYDNFRLAGCLDDRQQSALGISQLCTGARRLCRDAPPLVDWRHVCD